jgi:hypothetical protein
MLMNEPVDPEKRDEQMKSVVLFTGKALLEIMRD